MSPNFFLFFMNISVSYRSLSLSKRTAYFLSRTFFAASTMWVASIP